MTMPRATYRLQFRDGMDFQRAAGLAPYLADLGVSHLYASPIFAATAGSTHGYDVTDHGRFDAVLGGEDGFAALSAALERNGIGLLLDIVPNHMAASVQNPWWRDVLRHGRDSAYARYFDIDWTAGKLLLPILGEPYGEAVAEGKLTLGERDGQPALLYYDTALPLAPGTEALGTVHDIHEAQHWRLAYWRLAREALTYRRFFEISELVGVRVEDRPVFDAVHRLALRLVADGTVDGLRIDHVDGLADPKAYLDTLRAAAAPRRPYIVIEKILGEEEELPADWATDGTTGYEIGFLLTALQIDSRNRAVLDQAWRGFAGDRTAYRQHVVEAKRRIFTVNLAGELRGLIALAARLAEADVASRDFGRDALRRAIIEIAAHLPVYRTYVDAHGASPGDRALIDQAVAQAKTAREAEDGRVLDFIAGLLLDSPAGSADRTGFIRRFQQATGPVMAKAVEDTVFYRFNRLLALNEVGAEPSRFGISVADFHAALRQRRADWPHALSATSTHDTKRGEDTRARIAVLSEMPTIWRADVARWHEATADLRRTLPDGESPGADVEWLLYQSLLGIWPADLDVRDAGALSDLAERLEEFIVKALREAKQRTSWTAPNRAFEESVGGFVRGILAVQRQDLLRDLERCFQPVLAGGFVNSLAQTALKLTLPGVPDIYQGTELPDLSLVDPDNRRPVDFDQRAALLAEPGELTIAQWRQGLPKFQLLARLLDLRRRQEALFRDGSYEPLFALGPMAEHIVAFARRAGSECCVTIVPRLPLSLLGGQPVPLLRPEALDGTEIELPMAGLVTLGGTVLPARVALGPLLAEFPVQTLATEPGGTKPAG